MAGRGRRAALLLGAAALLSASCRGCITDLPPSRRIVTALDLEPTPLQVTARTEGKHHGACSSLGKGFAFTPFDEWTSTLAIEAPSSVDVFARGYVELGSVQRGSAGDPFGAVDLDLCPDADKSRTVLRVKASNGEPPRPFVAVLSFDLSVVLVELVGSEAMTCSGALATVSSADDWLVASLTPESPYADLATDVALTDHFHGEAMLTSSISRPLGEERRARIVKWLELSERLRDRLLDALSPGKALAIGELDPERNFDAMLETVDPADRKHALQAALEDCDAPVTRPLCTTARLQAIAGWVAKEAVPSACDTLAEIGTRLATEGGPFAEPRALAVFEAASRCASSKTMRAFALAALDPRLSPGESLVAYYSDLTHACTQGKVERLEATSLPALAAMWLASHCEADIVRRAQEVLAHAPPQAVANGARCVVSRCAPK